MLEPNTILQGRYLVIRQLGQGGMGTVYEALDQRLSSIVALKETAVDTNEMRRAFEREAALLANLRHPSLPKVIDYFIEGETQVLVMEYIPGNDLAELLALRGRAFTTDEVLRWADVVLNALEFLHTRTPPIIHRDIKPGNLKLTKEGELFLLDFGLAKGSAGQMATFNTSRSVVGYTPVYSSLEQINGTGTDTRSDIYSLGATLYHLITGVVPKDALGRATAIMNGESDPLSPPHLLNPSVSEAVSAVLMSSLKHNRQERPSSAAAFRNLLRDAGLGKPKNIDVIPYAPTIASATPAKKHEPDLPPVEKYAAPIAKEEGVSQSTQGYEQQNTASKTIVATEPIRQPSLPNPYVSQSYTTTASKRPTVMIIVAAAVVLVIGLIVGVSLWGGSRDAVEDSESKPSSTPATASSPTTQDAMPSGHQMVNSNTSVAPNSNNITTSNASNYPTANVSTSNTTVSSNNPVNRPARSASSAATANAQRPRRRRPSTRRDETEN